MWSPSDTNLTGDTTDLWQTNPTLTSSSCFLVFMLLCDPFFFSVIGFYDLFLNHRIWQWWGDGSPMFRFYFTAKSGRKSLLSLCYINLHLTKVPLSAGLEESSRHFVNYLWRGLQGKELWAAYRSWKSKSYSHKEMNSDNNQVELGRGFFPHLDSKWNCSLAVVSIMRTWAGRTQLICVQTPDPLETER